MNTLETPSPNPPVAPHTQNIDVMVIGAGAAGMMCAWQAGLRGRSVVLIDHAKRVGAKIKISGGGRCNFTNMGAEPSRYISNNPHFIKSALHQYTQWDFIDMVNRHNIAYHEKTLGQLFCDTKSQQIIDMMVDECERAGVTIKTQTTVSGVQQAQDKFTIDTSAGIYRCESLVIATGGLSLPNLGATPFGYHIAKQFDMPIITTAPALVSLTFDDTFLSKYKDLTGLSVDAIASSNNTQFREAILFTHKGLSGPAILQISSYMNDGDDLTLNLCPDHDMMQVLLEAKQQTPKRQITTVLSGYLPDRLVDALLADWHINPTQKIGEMSDKSLQTLAEKITAWQITPNGTTGYKIAEVTRGGVDTDYLSSKTMMTKHVNGLYFIGEVVDVTGWLGGYNLQWAWSSGYVAGQHA